MEKEKGLLDLSPEAAAGLLGFGSSLLQNTGWSYTPTTTSEALGYAIPAGMQAYGNEREYQDKLRQQVAERDQQRQAAEMFPQLMAEAQTAGIPQAQLVPLATMARMGDMSKATATLSNMLSAIKQEKPDFKPRVFDMKLPGSEAAGSPMNSVRMIEISPGKFERYDDGGSFSPKVVQVDQGDGTTLPMIQTGPETFKFMPEQKDKPFNEFVVSTQLVESQTPGYLEKIETVRTGQGPKDLYTRSAGLVKKGEEKESDFSGPSEKVVGDVTYVQTSDGNWQPKWKLEEPDKTPDSTWTYESVDQQDLANMEGAPEGLQLATSPDGKKEYVTKDFQPWAPTASFTPQMVDVPGLHTHNVVETSPGNFEFLSKPKTEPVKTRVVEIMDPEGSGRKIKQLQTAATGTPIRNLGFSDVAPDMSESSLDRASKLRQEYIKLTNPFQDINTNYQRVKYAAEIKTPTAASDLALIFMYMKMLDPTSVVRESEQQMALKATSATGALVNMANRVANGKLLNGTQRKQFLEAATGLFESQRGALTAIDQHYTDLSANYKVKKNLVVFDRMKTQKGPVKLDNYNNILVKNGGNIRIIQEDDAPAASQESTPVLDENTSLEDALGKDLIPFP